MTKLEQIRTALADYVTTEGCDCCQQREPHTVALERLALMLDVPAYNDNSGYNFYPFMSDTEKRDAILAKIEV